MFMSINIDSHPIIAIQRQTVGSGTIPRYQTPIRLPIRCNYISTKSQRTVNRSRAVPTVYGLPTLINALNEHSICNAFSVEIENENRRWIDWIVQFNKTGRNRILTILTLRMGQNAHRRIRRTPKTANRRMRYWKKETHSVDDGRRLWWTWPVYERKPTGGTACTGHRVCNRL